MKVNKNKIVAKVPRRTYHKPQLEKIHLVPEEAVLTACKQTNFHIFNALFDSGCWDYIFSCVSDGS